MPRPTPLPVLALLCVVAGPGAACAAAAPSVAAPVTTIVRATPVSGRHAATRIEVRSADGRWRRAAELAGDAGATALSPDGRRLALVRGDGRVTVLPVHGGRTRSWRPPDLPRAGRPNDLSAWSVAAGTDIDWTPDGRAFVVHRVASRMLVRLGYALHEQRAVLCRVAARRCSTAGSGAAGDLMPLGPGRMLRFTGDAADTDSPGSSGLSGFSARQRAAIERATRVRRATALTVVGRGAPRRLFAARERPRDGTPTLAPSGPPGPAGVLVRRTRTVLRTGVPNELTPGVRLRSTLLPTWLVTPRGRVRALPVALTRDPVGVLASGRWVLPEAIDRDPRRSPTIEAPKQLRTLDARGRERTLLVAGRPVTPVRLSVEAGLPDTFAVGAAVTAVVQARGTRDLLVSLSDQGADGIIFLPGDAALVRIPLDGSHPATVVDHEWGADYDVR